MVSPGYSARARRSDCQYSFSRHRSPQTQREVISYFIIPVMLWIHDLYHIGLQPAKRLRQVFIPLPLIFLQHGFIKGDAMIIKRSFIHHITETKALRIGPVLRFQQIFPIKPEEWAVWPNIKSCLAILPIVRSLLLFFI